MFWLADTAKAGAVLGGALGLPVPAAAALFVTTVGGSCFVSSAQQMDKINSALVVIVVLVFLVSLPTFAHGVVTCQAAWHSAPPKTQ